MAYPTDRVILFDRTGQPLRELSPAEVLMRTRSEEINAEHALTIVTTRRMEEGWRALTVDAAGTWREWVLTEPDEDHSSGRCAIGTYRFVWSLQYDLTGSYAHSEAEAGMGEDCTAEVALTRALEGVARWGVGYVDAPAIEAGKGCVMIYESAWSRLSKVVEATGGEVGAEIDVSPIYGVTARRVTLAAHLGSETPTRRFDWGQDVSSIRRTPDPGPYYCRVVPLGKGETEYAEDDETTFEWPLDITEETGTAENPGPYWIQDDEAALAFRQPDGSGGWWYPTKAVKYDEDDPELLLNAATEDLHNHTRPGVTYEADVVQYARAGMDVHGVELGDEVQIVDRGFNADAPLRLQGRVVKIEVDELSPETGTTLIIGTLRDNMTTTIANALSELSSVTTQVSRSVADMTTSRYIKELLDRINAEIAATGGYAYLVEGEGIITYDVAVADPLVGTEATQVVQIKGGSIRIANSKKPNPAGINDWNWKTVFQAGYIGTDLLTATNVVTGIIEDGAHRSDPATGNYWNLDTGELRMAGTATIGGSTVANIVSDALQNETQAEVFEKLTGGFTNEGIYINNGHLYLNASYMLAGVIGNPNGNYWDLTNGGMRFTGDLAIIKQTSSGLNPTYVKADVGDFNVTDARGVVNNVRTQQTFWGFRLYRETSSGTFVSGTDLYLVPIAGGSGSQIMSSRSLQFVSNVNDDTTNFSASSFIELGEYARIGSSSNGRTGGSMFEIRKGSLYYSGINPSSSSPRTTLRVTCGISDATTDMRFYGDITCEHIIADNNKSRLVHNDELGDRLLYCYEMPTPMFGDIGSATTDADGVCYVSIDDVFAETVRTDLAYQVFLQKCGDGDVWVEEKRPSFFVVRGTPNLPFDWEVKARQFDQVNTRLENHSINEATKREGEDLADGVIAAYAEEEAYAETIEAILLGGTK